LLVDGNGADEVLVTGSGLEELAELTGVAGALDEAEDPQPANARVARQASAAAVHLVRELPNRTITFVPSNTIRASCPLHYDDADRAQVAAYAGGEPTAVREK
jgi:hypothetical protein